MCRGSVERARWSALAKNVKRVFEAKWDMTGTAKFLGID